MLSLADRRRPQPEAQKIMDKEQAKQKARAAGWRTQPCKPCHGSGRVPHKDSNKSPAVRWEACANCDGEGELWWDGQGALPSLNQLMSVSQLIAHFDKK
jgi:hypothetical protein